MKITTFDPIILSPKADEAIKVFEELGFEKTHAPVTDTGKSMVQSVRMKDGNGFHIDISYADTIPQDKIYIRMNVDDFDEAYDILKKHGFTNKRGDDTLDTNHAKEATMVSPSGFTIALIKHVQ